MSIIKQISTLLIRFLAYNRSFVTVVYIFYCSVFYAQNLREEEMVYEKKKLRLNSHVKNMKLLNVEN
jgi:hypothetical protein